jgi:two-component system OmpR family response regulator
LVARIRAVMRRFSDHDEHVAANRQYRFSGFMAEPSSRRVVDEQGQEVVLTAAEFDLLVAFLERPGRVLSREQLLDITQGREAGPFDRSIDVLVSRLRRKLGDQGTFNLLKTQRNGGYQFAARVEAVECDA